MFGTIKKIETIHGFKIQPVSDMNGQNGARLGMAQMRNALAGYSEYDGYGVETDKHRVWCLSTTVNHAARIEAICPAKMICNTSSARNCGTYGHRT